MKKKKNDTKRMRKARKIIALAVFLLFVCPILAWLGGVAMYIVGEELEQAQINAKKAKTAKNIPTLEPLVEELWSETFLESEDIITDEYYPYLGVHYYATQCITGYGVRHYISNRSLDEIGDEYSVHFAQKGWDVSRCSECDRAFYYFDKPSTRVVLFQDNGLRNSTAGKTNYHLSFDYWSPDRCRGLP